MEENKQNNDFTSENTTEDEHLETTAQGRNILNHGDSQMNTDDSSGSRHNQYWEESAAELAPGLGELDKGVAKDGEQNRAGEGKGMGYAALILAIISLFAVPVLFGGIAIVLGFIARRSEASRKLGAWAIGIGIFSLIIGVLILPFF
ncbi:hypothetical protein V1498_06495 [Peribacillus sp. SCS-26]|uniref:hypothetical protein n=1 Tax=Paraperibacillus marinus TaxID=3115295 RepID=UPI0039064A62